MNWRGWKVASVLVAGLLLWQLASAAHLIGPLLLASPWRIGADLLQSLGTADFWSDVRMTLHRVFFAFLLAVLGGVPLGLWMGSSRGAMELLGAPVDFARSIPATALFPLFMLFLGVGEASRIAVAVYGCALIMVVNTISGVRQANQTRVIAGRIYGAQGLKLFVWVIIPEAIPSIITGMRLSISLAFVIIVLVEMFIGTEGGLGQRIINAQILYNIPRMYSSIAVIGTTGYLSNWAMLCLEKRVAHFVGK